MNVNLFWSKVEKADGCWNWVGRVCLKGYGYFDRSKGRAMKWKERAHRIAWVLTNGPIPDGLHVLHKCDNRKCVNPDHLFLGTHQENMDDKVRKGRQARNTHIRGEQTSGAILTDDQVRQIRALSGKMSQRKIGALFGVGQSHVSRIVNGVYWTHL